MHPQHLDLLVCPHSRRPLSLQVTEQDASGAVLTGQLVSDTGVIYPIVRGIPRFVDDQAYAASFGYEWSRWPRLQFESENEGRPMAGHTTHMWNTTTGQGAADLSGQTVVEFGCGSGRFLDMVRRQRGRAVGIDISMAVEAAHSNFAADPQVLIVQGDVLNPPFPAAAFDGGYSIGVFHHTPDPQQGVRELTRTVRPGGWCAVTVYPKGEYYDYPSLARLRTMLNRLEPRLARRLAMAYAYLSAYLLSPLLTPLRRLSGFRSLVETLDRNWLVLLRLPDVRWAVLDIFDAITPAIATTHTEEEVRGWMQAAGCEAVQTTPWCSTSLVGRKAAPTSKAGETEST